MFGGGLTCREKTLHNVPGVNVQYTASVLIEQTLKVAPCEIIPHGLCHVPYVRNSVAGHRKYLYLISAAGKITLDYIACKADIVF